MRNRARRRFAALAAGLFAVLALLVAACGGPASDPAADAPAAPPTTTTTLPPRPAVYEAACKGKLVATTLGTIASSSVTELSGLAASRRNPGVWWVENDSGHPAEVFAVGNDGRDLGKETLSGATNVDWEDIAVGPGLTPGVNYLYLADIGDNTGKRTSIAVYRVPEPAVDPNATTPPAPATLTGVEKLTLTYPQPPLGDGAHDAESLFVDPTTGELYIITKFLALGSSHVYRAPANLAAGSTTALTDVATLSIGEGLTNAVTAADITPAGDVIAVRTYTAVLLFERPSGASVGDALTHEPCHGATSGTELQGEAVGFTTDGRAYVTAAEGASPGLHQFSAP